MRQRLTRTDLTEASVLQREALRAIHNGNYETAFELANAVDQVFYRKGIDVVEASDWAGGDLNKLYDRHNEPRTTSWGVRRKPYAWEIRQN